MSLNDNLSDMLTRIRNAHSVKKEFTFCLSSKLNINVLKVLKNEGYIRDFSTEKFENGKQKIKIELKYNEGQPVIKKIKRISKPGIRVYRKIKELPQSYGGLGISILSTPKGVMSDSAARNHNVGGEILCQMF